MSDVILYNEVKRKMINKLYPVGTANGYPLNVREYLTEKNNLVISGICNYIAPRYKGQESQSIFDNLLKSAFNEMKIDTNSLYNFDEKEFEIWANNKALEKAEKKKR